MSYEQTFTPQSYTLADRASSDARAAFILKTYLHLFGAIIAFMMIETVLLFMPFAPRMTEIMLTGAGGYAWLLVLGAFMLVSGVANRWAVSATSVGTQYMGLGLYVVAEAVIFVPLLYIAAVRIGPQVILTAGLTTLVTFTGLTGIVALTRKNFSFLGPFLGMLGFAAFALIACSIIFGFSLGMVFTWAMIVFACAYILYTTSNVLHEYHIGQHVAASLALFACVALLFWYILRLFMSRD